MVPIDADHWQASRGVFRLTRLERQTTLYRLKAPAQEARKVLIDHPRHADWKLVTPRWGTASKLERGKLFRTIFGFNIGFEPV